MHQSTHIQSPYQLSKAIGSYMGVYRWADRSNKGVEVAAINDGVGVQKGGGGLVPCSSDKGRCMEGGLVFDVGKYALEEFWRKHFAVLNICSVIMVR